MMNPYDGGGVNLNPRPIGRNPEPRRIATERKGPRATAPTVGRHNPRCIGADRGCASTAATTLTTATPRSRMLYG